MTNLLSAVHLRKSFGGVRAVDDMSFDVRAGELLALIGPNGAGKSTCFNLLNGQLRPDGGQVLLDGQDITGWPPRRITRLGVGRSFQTASGFASMTVRENLQVGIMSHAREIWRFIAPAGGRRRAEAEALLDEVGLADRAGQGCGTLAYGDLKRLDLALALTNTPRLLLMDEPTAGLTPAERRVLVALIRAAAHGRGCAVLFTEHDMDMVFHVADRILVMDRGSLIAEGDAASVRADPRVRAAYLGTG